MSIRRVNSAEDLRDYEADKLLHTAYKIRDEVQATHSTDKLYQMWIEQERAALKAVNSPTSDGTNQEPNNVQS